MRLSGVWALEGNDRKVNSEISRFRFGMPLAVIRIILESPGQFEMFAHERLMIRGNGYFGNARL